MNDNIHASIDLRVSMRPKIRYDEALHIAWIALTELEIIRLLSDSVDLTIWVLYPLRMETGLFPVACSQLNKEVMPRSADSHITRLVFDGLAQKFRA